MLNPGSWFQVTMAYGLTIGTDIDSHNSLLLTYTRQSQNRNTGADALAHARQFALAVWEHAFREVERYRTQWSARLELGYLARDPWQGAFTLGVGATMRYAVAQRFAFVGVVDDRMASLPLQMLPPADCGGAPAPCAVGGYLQHNFGVLFAFEFRR